MEQNIQPKPVDQNNKRTFAVIGSILLTGLVVGLGVYFWQKSSFEKKLANQNEIFQQKITKLENQIKESGRQSQTQSTSDLESYSNNYYGFSISFPKGTEFCLNDFCQNDILDQYLQYFRIYPDSTYLEIYPLKNSLGMSAIDFAKRSLELNRQYRQDGHAFYSNERISQFAGEKSYEFTATGGFEERGKKIGTNGAENAPEFFATANEGRTLNVPYKIIYFDHNGTMYRIIYPSNDESAQKMISSFKFLN